MNILENLFNIINELKSTNSANKKVKILSRYKNDINICKLFKYIYNPYYKYGITSKNLQKNENLVELEFYDIFTLLDDLRNRKITGNKAISIVNGFINQNINYTDLLYDIFDRNLKIGMNVTQINKCLNNIIPVFDVALAAIYDEEKKEKYKLEDYIIEQKCNGLRLINIITYNKEKNCGEIKSYSRKGLEFTTCQKIQDELMEYYKTSKYFGQDIVLDGECCIINAEGKEDWNSIVSEAKRKNYTIEHPKYIIFDFLTLDEFSGITPSHEYMWRRDKLMRLFFGFKGNQQFKYLDVIFATPYSEDHYNTLMKRFVETDKWEGLIFRKNCAYKPGRSTDLLKVKLFKDEEFTVFDIEKTTKPMLNISTEKMEQKECVGSLLFKLEDGNICKVGTGISDNQRLEWMLDPSKILGKQIQVKYKERTKNADGTSSLQFPVLTHVFDEDRDF